MESPMVERMNGMQIRMARAGLGWTIAELAKRANVGMSSVKAIESGFEVMGGLPATRDYREAARASVLDAITAALVAAGATPLPDNGQGAGVRCKPKGRRGSRPAE